MKLTLQILTQIKKELELNLQIQENQLQKY